MSEYAIRVDGVGKSYRLGRSGTKYNTLRDNLANLASSPMRLLRRSRDARVPAEPFWALKDVSFEIKEGEVVGIIGRNGAGKSTLLKILSRITEPTEGEVDLHGRVGSLLEVGTGFHGELSGRENIFLNGAILGMRRAEIARKFDEIVAFAEVEKFIDTPVKHYSSGMYVRLAFAVAAHLEPEILIVDEVLAVGDVEFQKKCLGKLGDVARDGRTVLFVSHNMASLQNLCSTGILLGQGKLQGMGPIDGIIKDYMSTIRSANSGSVDLHTHSGRKPGMSHAFTKVVIYNRENQQTSILSCGDRAVVELHLSLKSPLDRPWVSIGVHDVSGQRLFTVSSGWSSSTLSPLGGEVIVRCAIEDLPLIPGNYTLTLTVGNTMEASRDWIDHAISFSVVASDFFGSGHLPSSHYGAFLMRSEWESHSERPIGSAS